MADTVNRIVGGLPLTAIAWTLISGPARARALAVLRVLALIALGAASMAWASTRAEAAAEVKALTRPPVTIAVLVSSRKDVCFDPGDVGAITKLVKDEAERINRQGGISGRPVQLKFLDDARDDARAIANVRSVIADPQTLAVVGLSNTARAKAVFDGAGAQIKDSGVPFLSGISVSSIFADHPNVFTMQATQDDERLPVLAEFTTAMGFARPAFVGLKDALYSKALAEGLKRVMGAKGLAADERLTLVNDKLDPAEIDRTVAAVKAGNTDLLHLNVGAARTGELMKRLVAAGHTPPLFITGRIEAIPAEVRNAYPNDIYQLAFDNLPSLDNDRLRRLMATSQPEEWVFEGREIKEAPGWAKGECKPRLDDVVPDPLRPANMRAIGLASQHADMVGLVAAIGRAADPRLDIGQLRAEILKELVTTYALGRGAFKGSFDNWSFDPSSRAASRTPLIVILPRGLGVTQLAPMQFVRLKKDVLRRINTLYLDIDLVRAHRVDDNEKTFYAEFYLSMHAGNNAGLDQIEFTNAFLDPRTNDRQITVRVLHPGGKSDAYPEEMKVYQIAGKFLFDPKLETYPFDIQRFAIDLQPKKGDAPFIVQPPPASRRDTQVATDGWDVKDAYVGYDEDFVPIVDALSLQPSVVPFYKASYVWSMRRQTTDYYLRVAIPLAFILLVAYLSIFIPQDHFEAIVTLQVTALLSAVALYLSLPKLDSDTATLSDRIFLYDYMLVSLMVGISILRVSPLVAGRPIVKASLALVHIVAIPLAVGAIAFWVHRASQAGL